jgi:5-formyltetrahydrofolate cyclo-ligase
MTDGAKQRLRSSILASRAAVAGEVRRAEAERLCALLPATVAAARVVAGYVPVGSEPGSPAMPDVLAGLCETVLLPVVGTGPAGEHLPLRWARYVPGQLGTARFGLREPTGTALPPDSIGQAQVVIVPALAVDRRGVRLGRGGGFYDRSLPLCAPGTPLVAVVRDDEVVDELPGEPHDVRMTHALSPGGLIPLHGGTST